jgi:hypothetical protein
LAHERVLQVELGGAEIAEVLQVVVIVIIGCKY